MTAGRRRRVARSVGMPAPVGGWNTSDGLAVMKPQFAVRLDNWFPESDSVRLRRGYARQSVNSAGIIRGLHAYEAGSYQQLLAWDQSTIYNANIASTAVAAMTILGTGYSNGNWRGLTMGQYALLVNGADTPKKWDGATLTDNTLSGSGLTPANLIGMQTYRARLFTWEDNSQAFWYGATQAISGTLQKFDLKYVGPTSGKIVEMGTWTFDGGAGPDDVLVILMSTGQVFVYSGGDPGNADDWALQGIYSISPPLGPGCVCQLGSDLIIGTRDGYFPISKALSLGKVSDAVSISDRINPSVRDAWQDQRDAVYGWQSILYPEGSMLINNIVIDADLGRYDQYVMNTGTGAWCRWTDQHARAWAVCAGKLWFGGNYSGQGAVYRADFGTDDDGAAITTYAQTAFSTMGAPGVTKRWTLARPIFRSAYNMPVSLGLAVDYQTAPTLTPVSISYGTPWDTSPWDTSSWTPENVIERNWQTVSGFGYAGSLCISTSTILTGINWYTTDFVFESGGIL